MKCVRQWFFCKYTEIIKKKTKTLSQYMPMHKRAHIQLSDTSTELIFGWNSIFIHTEQQHNVLNIDLYPIQNRIRWIFSGVSVHDHITVTFLIDMLFFDYQNKKHTQIQNVCQLLIYPCFVNLFVLCFI